MTGSGPWERGKRQKAIPFEPFGSATRKDAGGYTVVGAVGAGCKKEIGEWKLGEESEKYYELPGAHFLYKTAGYIEVGENIYLAVRKSRLVERLLEALLLLAVVAGIGAGIYLLVTGT